MKDFLLRILASFMNNFENNRLFRYLVVWSVVVVISLMIGYYVYSSLTEAFHNFLK